MKIRAYLSLELLEKDDSLMAARISMEIQRAHLNGVFDNPDAEICIGGITLYHDSRGLYCLLAHPMGDPQVPAVAYALPVICVTISEVLMADSCQLPQGWYGDNENLESGQALLQAHPNGSEDHLLLTVTAYAASTALKLYDDIRSGQLQPTNRWTDTPAIEVQ